MFRVIIMNKIKSRRFFSLAEVLVTLAVIGILVVLTIPTLMQNINDNQYKTAGKKAYYDLNQVITRMVKDKGTLKDYIGVAGSFYPAFKEYYEEMIGCGLSGCVISTDTSTVYKTYSGNPAFTWLFDEGQLIGKNGMFIMIQNSEDKDLTIIISVDVNGYKKGPNVLGKDVFTFQIVDDVLKPMGAPGTARADHNLYCSKTSENALNGISCTQKMIMGEDY